MAEQVTNDRLRGNAPDFGIKDKMGYAAGDIANNLTFMMASSFLMIFYTEVLLISPSAVGTLFMVSRLADAFTDVGMGKIADNAKPTKDGKFKPWIKRIAIPIAFVSFLMYQSYMVNFPMVIRMIYMYVTYLLWGSVFYTAINIPYGSMAAVISPNPDDRTDLSVWRGAGATIANGVLGVVVPFFIYGMDEAGNQIVRGGWVFPAVAAVLSVLAVVFYYITFKWTHERVSVDEVKEGEEKKSTGSFFSVMKSRSLLAIMAASVTLLLVMISMNQLNTYLFPFYYGSARGLSLVMFIQPIATLAIVYPIATKLSRAIGKKESAAIGMIVGAAAYFVLYFMRPENMYVYIAISTLGYMGMNIFNATVWASVTDVVDDHEVRTRERADGTIYGINSFSRKAGQALAGGIAGWSLGWIGYDQTLTVQPQAVLESLYDVTVLIPAIGFLVGAIILIFWYPLSKKRVAENTEILNERAND